MTNVHEQCASCRALDTLPRAIVEAASARETLHALLGGAIHDIRVGWPMFAPPPTLRASDALIELTSGLQAAFELALAVPVESAAGWVDRALGSAESGFASADSALSEPELGVLAYLASRTCAALGGLQVLDVHTRANVAPHVRWPIAIAGDFERCELACLIAPWRADAITGHFALRASLFERAPDRFAVGDVWIGERWNMSSTSAGLAGELQLAVDGSSQTLSAIIGEGHVTALAPGGATDALELVLGTRHVSFSELARVAAGEPLALEAHQGVVMRLDGRVVARGELISWRGAIGVRISEA